MGKLFLMSFDKNGGVRLTTPKNSFDILSSVHFLPKNAREMLTEKGEEVTKVVAKDVKEDGIGSKN